MALTIVEYQAEHEPLVAAFNEEGRRRGAPFALSSTHLSQWLPALPGRSVVRQLFLALDNDRVAGGFALRRQPFWINGREVPVGNYQGPLSAGIWDRKYMMSGVQMLKYALKQEPNLYALGMGGVDQPLPRLLTSAGWRMLPVPFYYRVLRPAAFLRNIGPLRTTRMRRALLDVAAATGLCGLAIQAVHAIRAKRVDPRGWTCEEVPEFAAQWGDEIWEGSKLSYRAIGLRNAGVQNTLYARGSKNRVLLMKEGGMAAGWCVVRCTQMQGDKYFGNMRLGSIVDCLAPEGKEGGVVMLAINWLRKQGADIAISNQSHRRWVRALAEAGCLEQRSNFIFACSPALAGQIGPLDQALPELHMNRSDGDGPIHL